MTAPELPMILKEIAIALNQKTNFPVELWDAVPAEALTRMVVDQNVLGGKDRVVVELAIAAWRTKVDDNKNEIVRRVASGSPTSLRMATTGNSSRGEG